ncbi:MAG: flagellar biosynthesis anti-sigma factor FlgM [Fibrobacteria bacterium]|nr:flagellar biosynthesis anti-sigma factor FlgM [Fibrobacteria bacterium]
METGQISQAIAQRLFYKGSRIPEALQKSDSSTLKAKDQINLSDTAVNYTNTQAGATDLEKERELHFQQVKNQVQTGNYHIDKRVVSQIAESIVASLPGM